MDKASQTLYVSPIGDDTADGLTIDTPLRTISQAATKLTAGDVCVIRAGVYRETIRPQQSGQTGRPIRFEAYPGERVVISGCDPVTGWTHHEHQIYKAQLDGQTIDSSSLLVFMNEELATEAQWPRMSDRLDRAQYGRVDTATNDYPQSTIYDEDLLAFPDGHWDGALVSCVNGVSYFMSTARVRRFERGTLYFDSWVSSAEHYHTQPDNLYFLTRSLNALVDERDWHYEADSGELYVIAPDGSHPDAHVIEVKRRQYAFDLRDRQHIQIQGIACLGATLTTEGAAHCVLDRISLYGLDRAFGYRQSIYGRTKGVELGGSDNTLSNSEISHFEGIGINVSGARNRVLNCYLHDGNYEASYASMIWMSGAEHMISHCTITRSGRTSISGVFARSTIAYCDISYANSLTKDSGMIYLYNHDFDSTQIHHNWLHDNLSDHLSFGFYMDAFTSGISFFRNVIWNIPERGMVLNRPIHRTLIYNNTFWRSAMIDSSVFAYDDMYGTHLANNLLADGIIKRWSDVTETSHNRTDVDARFVNAEQGDFRLLPDSPAIGQGREIAGITDGYQGEAPDVGAYEYGGEDWRAGHNFENVPVIAAQDWVELAHESRLRNGGFESGELAPWRAEAGEPRIVRECAWDYSRNGAFASVVRNNRYAAALRDGDQMSQTITGLKPSTRYVFFAAVKSGGEYREAVLHDGAEGGDHWEREADGSWGIYRDAAYIGPVTQGQWLKFADINFGDKSLYDMLAFGLNKVRGPIEIQLRLGAVDGPMIGNLSRQMDFDGVWHYFDTPIAPISGVHDIYLVVAGEGSCLVQSLALYHSTWLSTANLTVRLPDGSSVSRLVKRANWESTISELAFTTPAEVGGVEVVIENAGGLAVTNIPSRSIYVDDCGVWEPTASQS